MNTLLTGLLTAMAIVVIAGCGSGGPETAEVTGVVTLEGKALANATIIFSPVAKGRPSVATSDAEGHYELMFTIDKSGAELGEHVVTITTGGEEYDDEGNEIERPETVPAMYNIEKAYKKKVEPGGNTIDLALKAGPIGGGDQPSKNEEEEEE